MILQNIKYSRRRRIYQYNKVDFRSQFIICTKFSGIHNIFFIISLFFFFLILTWLRWVYIKIRLY